jgi:uncharacterized phiE125 gp8 family phage protein
MDFKIITDVASDKEPITLAEARLQCKVDADDTSHDALLTGLITTVRQAAEHYTGLALAPRTLEAALDEFPRCRESIWLPMPPVTAITSIKYTDPVGDEQTLDSGGYTLGTYGDMREVTLTYGNNWPSTRCEPNAVRIRFECGYGAEEGPPLPHVLKSAMLLHIETESPLNPLTPAERTRNEKARDALLDICKRWER